MSEMLVRVECYAGYKGDERPLRVYLGGHSRQVLAVEDRWYSPGATYFRVVLDGGDRFVLHREDGQDLWSLCAFRAENKPASRH